MKLLVGYSKAPEQLQSSARPICQSHTMTSTGREPATICITVNSIIQIYSGITCGRVLNGELYT